MRKVSLLFVIVLSFTACNKTLYNPQVDEKITVSKAQKDIKVGMSSSEIIEIMGSPNIISTDEQRREVWVYDKISTQRAYQNSYGSISIILAGVTGNSGSNVSTQRTLTVIIKFDNNQKVRDVAYHTSSF
ncbi:SmpA / OmlA family [Campylobacter insulaenigrae]|uniref:outer membrane protein assembly factor BamE domain-containing protein n=1 Tax=Campylobacter insulaenigrae TaxID=260714 RepID=UPI000F6EA8EE|nr:outer membrane protein assembly factor BamE [Campylobacter insulaenigrae]MCR6591306.1 outer membrane protein assembly factor BamE [Campylobacter insulaenigrae]MCR6592798.1 outer membrane protein assembly factor BamE [Campylobacter insulaenigrae]VEJ52592.1 SmpA / OmlA family [Campylobacter insulaenigrae]